MSKKSKNKKQAKQAQQTQVPETSPEPHISKDDVPIIAQDHLVDARMLALRHPEFGNAEQGTRH